jgi:hypothetical protein
MGIVTGWLLPKGSHVEPIEVMVDGYKSLVELIDCDMVDAVHIGIANKEGEHQMLIGYIDDEGMNGAEGINDINFLASFLFRRSDPVYGNVVVVAGLSPDGEYDGENYDLPTWVTEIADEVVDEAADMYNTFVISLSALAVAAEDGLITVSEIDKAADEADDADDSDALSQLIATSLRYMDMRMEQMNNGEELVDFDEGLRRMLEEEGNK